MSAALSVLGIVLMLLGGLWLVQGLGLVTIEPLLCLAECESVEGPAITWAIGGLVAMLLGGLALSRVRRG